MHRNINEQERSRVNTSYVQHQHIYKHVMDDTACIISISKIIVVGNLHDHDVRHLHVEYLDVVVVYCNNHAQTHKPNKHVHTAYTSTLHEHAHAQHVL